jgi:hypothetical protein
MKASVLTSKVENLLFSSSINPKLKTIYTTASFSIVNDISLARFSWDTQTAMNNGVLKNELCYLFITNQLEVPVNFKLLRLCKQKLP